MLKEQIHRQNFEKLSVWQKAVAFANECYRQTKTFPKEEIFGLTSQIRRSSVSISSNLAEGSSRSSKQDFSRFIEIATGSAFETFSLLTIAKEQKMINITDHDRLAKSCTEIIQMLSGLRRSLKRIPMNIS